MWFVLSFCSKSKWSRFLLILSTCCWWRLSIFRNYPTHSSWRFWTKWWFAMDFSHHPRDSHEFSPSMSSWICSTSFQTQVLESWNAATNRWTECRGIFLEFGVPFRVDNLVFQIEHCSKPLLIHCNDRGVSYHSNIGDYSNPRGYGKLGKWWKYCNSPWITIRTWSSGLPDVFVQMGYSKIKQNQIVDPCVPRDNCGTSAFERYIFLWPFQDPKMEVLYL